MKRWCHNTHVPVTMSWPSHLPYLIWAMSPTAMSDTGSWMTWLPRTTWNFCSCSMRLCSPRNCFSFDQSLKAVTSTTHTTDSRMAAPSIQPASASPSSSTPPAAMPHAAFTRTKTTNVWTTFRRQLSPDGQFAFNSFYLMFNKPIPCHVTFDITR